MGWDPAPRVPCSRRSELDPQDEEVQNSETRCSQNRGPRPSHAAMASFRCHSSVHISHQLNGNSWKGNGGESKAEVFKALNTIAEHFLPESSTVSQESATCLRHTSQQPGAQFPAPVSAGSEPQVVMGVRCVRSCVSEGRRLCQPCRAQGLGM